MVIIIVLAVIAGGLLVATIYKLMRRPDPEAVRLKATPKRLEDLLQDILQLRMQIRDSTLRGTIREMCVDIDNYFERYCAVDEREDDTSTFGKHLEDVKKVLIKYIDIQDHSRYYSDPEAAMETGYKAVQDFSDFVLRSIQAGNNSSLMTYRVDSGILSAKKY